MTHRFAEIAFTPAVKKTQEEFGSRAAYARMEGGGGGGGGANQPRATGGGPPAAGHAEK
jgi:hypothetical protein